MIRVLRGVVVLCVALAVAAGAAFALGAHVFNRAGPATAETTVVIPKGDGLAAIAARLEDAGIVDQAMIFRLGVRLSGAAAGMRAGEYLIPPGASMAEVAAILGAGRTVARRLTVPEGLTSAEIVALVAATPGLDGAAGPVPAEGTLLPETYHYSYGDSRASVIARMGEAMTATLVELWPGRAAGLPLATPAEAVVLASIVEKETGLAAERPRVAGVFINRLERGIPLQADPTVAYALIADGDGDGNGNGNGNGGDRPLSRADLDRPSPYNTYLVRGLPPGPIANPGRASLEAVLHPADTDELYFVADGSGGHAFARTLDEHNRNVATWRRLRK